MGAPVDPQTEGHPQRHIGAVAVYTGLLSLLVLSGTVVGIVIFNKECFKSGSGGTHSSNYTSPFTYTWSQVRLYYFRGDCLTYQVGNIEYEMKDVNYASRRTLTMLWVYFALNIVWFIGSFLLLVSAAIGKRMRQTMGKYLHYSWFLSTVSILISDVIFPTIFLIDLMYTSSTEDLNNFLLLSEKVDSETIQHQNLPPIIMALLFSKGVIFWVLHVALIFIIKNQCGILQKRREHFQFLQLQMDSTPVYLRPTVVQSSKLAEDNKEIPTVPTLPRFTNVNGKFIGSNCSEEGSRPSTLQKAARHGFNYVDPSSKPWSTRSMDFHNSPSSPSSMAYEHFSFGEHITGMYGQAGHYQEPSQMHSMSRNTSHRSRERPASLQQGIDVFY